MMLSQKMYTTTWLKNNSCDLQSLRHLETEACAESVVWTLVVVEVLVVVNSVVVTLSVVVCALAVRARMPATRKEAKRILGDSWQNY